jgi:Zn-finger nucleic acid-binding protein
MIAPQPFKFVCPKCGHTNVVKPKSDVLNPTDFIDICPKCKTKMDKKPLGFLDKLF